MNIIFLIGQLRYSGAENVLRCIATEIAHAGHNVEIMVRAEGYENETLPDRVYRKAINRIYENK